ncbi:hypothetical protein LTR66_009574 [Elasticomyces elasticus]|nr:hypothetical protein LTR66_009574 [Elasticomyces elasticus]
MAVKLVMNSPLAEALQNVVQPRLQDEGWSTGDDSALTEYIILMLVNGKTQEQISSELSNDLLGLAPGDPTAAIFSTWLFKQVDVLNAQLNGAATGALKEAPTQPAETQHGQIQKAESAGTDNAPAVQDSQMGDADVAGNGAVPTGPKSMRTAAPAAPNPRTRDKRMLGQLKSAMDRTPDAALHRVRAGPGVGRVNTHGQPPKGPRNMANTNIVNGMQRLTSGRPPMGGLPMQTSAPQTNPAAQQNPMSNFTPQQQMALLQHMEQQAALMAQILSPQQAQQLFNNPAGNAAFQNGGMGSLAYGKPFSGRMDNRSRQNNNFNARQSGLHAANGGHKDPNAPMEIDAPLSDTHTHHKDPFSVVCRWNAACTNATCPYAHQSPAAPPGIAMDITDTCSFGTACQNHKCAGRHPSPGQRRAYVIDTECKFYPACTNPKCPFKHPDAPPCRNGADCETPGCAFAHSKIQCRHHPCLYTTCPFKHEPGQKKPLENKVWKNASWTKEQDGEDIEHVSERKFVEDGGQEELILPGRGEVKMEAGEGSKAEDDMIT